MKFFQHAYWAIRYGEWSWGWEQYEGKPQFAIVTTYYDGNWIAIHVWKLWICCNY